MDICSESVVNIAVKKLPNDIKNKWLTYLQSYDASYKNIRVFSARLRNIMQVQENMTLQFGSASDKARKNFKRDKTIITNFDATSDSGSPTKTQFPLKDGEHNVWQCHKLKKMKLAEQHETVKKCKLCFSDLGLGHRIGQCKTNRTFGKDSCSKRHNRFWRSDENELGTQKKQNKSSEKNNKADSMLRANSCSGSLQIVPITLSSGAISIDTMAFCDTGSTLSFVDKHMRDQLGVLGNKITLNIAGVNGTKEMAGERVRINVTTPNLSE